jgi:glucokinase
MPPRKGGTPRRSHPTRAIIGAGTGLGKSILIYDKGLGLYLPHPSEGGHTEFPATSPWERDLVDFVKDLEKGRRAISYEDLLSGRGLESIYKFLRQKGSLPKTRFTGQIDEAEEKASLISQYVDRDETCRETFRLFLELYAKCARNFALDTLALGGIYLAGGILAKNLPHIDQEVFRQHFEENDRHPEILRAIPIQVISNYDVSLWGAAFAASLPG